MSKQKMETVEFTSALNSPDYGDIEPGDVKSVTEADAKAFIGADLAKKTKKSPVESPAETSEEV